MKRRTPVGVTLLTIASLYLVAALLLGLAMALSRNFTLLSVHSHLALLGWAAMAITGLAYLALPRLAASKLATAHFWLHNLGLPIMMGGLTIALTLADTRFEPVIGVGSILVIAGLLAFTINLISNRNAEAAAGREEPVAWSGSQRG